MILRYHPLARKEVIEAAEHLESVRPGLGAEFLEEIDKAIGRILDDPLTFEQIRPGIRRCIVNRFPYSICYRLPDSATIRITVIKHHARRPGLGLRRE